MTSVPSERPERLVRGIQRASARITRPAPLACPRGHHARTGRMHPAPSGCTSTRPPCLSTGSRRRNESRTGPTGSRDGQLCPSWSQATSPLTLPSTSAAQSMAVKGRRRSSPIVSDIPAIQPEAPKCRRPVERPAPYAMANKIGGRSLTAAPLELRRTSSSPAAGCHRDLP
jgi:hypothetical protein